MITISTAAKEFMKKRGIEDVTFNLLEMGVACCLGVVREIQPVYSAPADASNYRYFRQGDYHIFIARQIRTPGPVTVKTEGIWHKRLFLCGATVPI